MQMMLVNDFYKYKNYIVLLFFLEIISFYYNLFFSFNSFLILYIWFKFLYNTYGLTGFEKGYKEKNKIQGSLFSFVYLKKRLFQIFYIKYLIINKFITAVYNKKLSIKDALFFIIVLLITLVLFRYLRYCLIVEIIDVFNLKSQITELLILSGFLLVKIIKILENFSNPFILNKLYFYTHIKDSFFTHIKDSFINTINLLENLYNFNGSNTNLYLIEKDFNLDISEPQSLIEQLTSMMRRSATLARNFTSSPRVKETPLSDEVLFRINDNVPVTKKELEDKTFVINDWMPQITETLQDMKGKKIPPQEANKTVDLRVTDDKNLKLPKFGWITNTAFLTSQSKNFYVHNGKLMFYNKGNLFHLEDYLNEGQKINRANLLCDNPHDVAQDLRITQIINPSLPYNEQKNIEFQIYRSAYPQEAKRAYEILYEFKRLSENDFNEFYAENYLKFFSKKDKKIFKHLMSEIPQIRLLLLEYPNHAIFGLHTKNLLGEPDAIAIMGRIYRLIQMKVRTDTRYTKPIINEFLFSSKYFYTNDLFLFCRNYIISVKKNFNPDGTLNHQTITASSIPKDLEMIEELLERNNSIPTNFLIQVKDDALEKFTQHTSSIKVTWNEEED